MICQRQLNGISSRQRKGSKLLRSISATMALTLLSISARSGNKRAAEAGHTNAQFNLELCTKLENVLLSIRVKHSSERAAEEERKRTSPSRILHEWDRSGILQPTLFI